MCTYVKLAGLYVYIDLVVAFLASSYRTILVVQ
jgi:hypothetical protein